MAKIFCIFYFVIAEDGILADTFHSFVKYYKLCNVWVPSSGVKETMNGSKNSRLFGSGKIYFVIGDIGVGRFLAHWKFNLDNETFKKKKKRNFPFIKKKMIYEKF